MAEATVAALPAFLSNRRPIRVLPQRVSERIAAGEVIDRPASVVRELVDNALDAGATDVTIDLRGSGLELIRVADDGRGVPPEELETAFVRHATSKIAEYDDLARLHTLGFRGEALPSIAAVAEITLLSRVPEEPSAASLTVSGGEVLRRGRMARQPGTTVTVRDLFQNVPARLKFLPAGRAESILVGQLVRRYALARPDVRFQLLLDGRPSFRAGGGTAESALAEVYGRVVADTLLPLRLTTEAARIDGLIGGRSATRPSRGQVTLVINGRVAISRGVSSAIEAAYRPLLPRGRHPIALIRIDVPPDELDANVHPAKSEVRLAREAEVAAALAELLRDALGRAPARPSADEEFALGPRQQRLPAPRRRLIGWESHTWEGVRGVRGVRNEIAESDTPYSDTSDADTSDTAAGLLDRARVLAQLHGTLILVETARGLLLVDQHRAHERVIYALLRERRGAPSAQSLLEPIVLELTPVQIGRLEERLGFLEELGFLCQRFGDREFLVRAVPSLPDAEELAEGLAGLLEEAASEEDDWQHRLMTAVSCRAAVRRGRPMAAHEMAELLRRLAATDAPATCPHGSPLILELDADFLERQFAW
jgi:DNA mismatch repair protein MutL